METEPPPTSSPLRLRISGGSDPVWPQVSVFCAMAWREHRWPPGRASCQKPSFQRLLILFEDFTRERPTNENDRLDESMGGDGRHRRTVAVVCARVFGDLDHLAGSPRLGGTAEVPPTGKHETL